jgi:hypothetical protein
MTQTCFYSAAEQQFIHCGIQPAVIQSEKESIHPKQFKSGPGGQGDHASKKNSCTDGQY